VEDFSRRALVALVVGAAGPATALLTLWLLAPSLVVATSPDTGGGLAETTGSLLVGLVLGTMLSVVIAVLVALGATYVALQRTGCPRPVLAWLVCLVATPVWVGAIEPLHLGVAGFLMLAGLLPASVRLGFGYAFPESGSNPISRTS
jgi:hypothetical protein